MNISEYIVRVLASRGVRQVFGYPGAAILPLMEAIDRHPDVEWVLMRHEGSASLAASIQARMTGRLAVCLASAGPGATNMFTGMFDAHLERSPVLALTGLVPTWQQSRSGFQDIDQTLLTKPLITRSIPCVHPDQIPSLLRDCIGELEQSREACHIAIPTDVQATEVHPDDQRYQSWELPEPLKLQSPPEAAIALVAAELSRLEHVVIVVGARAYGAGPAIEALAERLQAPIISALDAKGAIDDDHPCALGVMGIFGAPGVETTHEVLAKANAILGFGVDYVAPFVMDKGGSQRRLLYQCEPDFSSITHRFKRERTLVGPLEQIAAGLAAHVTGVRDASLLERARRLKESIATPGGPAFGGPDYADPVALLRALSERLGAEDVVVADVGDSTIWAAKFLHFAKRQRLLVSNVMGVMGISVPGAIGAKLAAPARRVVAICGDGAFQMSLAELLSAVQAQAEIVVLVFTNGWLQRVAAQQGRPHGTKLHNPDFMALAKACGADGAVFDGRGDAGAVLDRAFATRGRPFLLEVRLHPDLRVPVCKSNDGFVPRHYA
jgi:thiamine pyrophosphate-dependent acetolactate synthase large subunit-like protein